MLLKNIMLLFTNKKEEETKEARIERKYCKYLMKKVDRFTKKYGGFNQSLGR
jgi:hypothetical protein